MSFFKHRGRTLMLAATAATVGLVWAQAVPGACPGDPMTNCGADADVALVPIVANFAPVDGRDTATVSAAFYNSADQYFQPMLSKVKAGTDDTLRLAVGGTGVRNVAQNRRGAGAAVRSRAGKVIVRLPERSYKSAEISLYAVNGKRIMRGKASVSSAANSLSRRDVTAGVYILSVKEADGGAAVTSRLTHRGGSLNISVSFVAGGAPDARRLPKRADDPYGDGSGYTIKVSAPFYADTAFDIHPKAGMNERLVINMRSAFDGFTDSRDGAEYKTVKIGGQVWMAENLNYETPEGSACYGNSSENCAKYGRLYDWETSLEACPAGWRLPNNRDWNELIAAVTGAEITPPPAIMFLIDHSQSMTASKTGGPGSDVNGNRFRVTKALVDTIFRTYPDAQVGVAVFAEGLVLNSSWDPNLVLFDGVTHPSGGANQSYLPMKALNAPASGGGYASGENPAWLHVIRGMFNVPADKSAKSTLRNGTGGAAPEVSGTNISIAFEAAQKAFESVSAPKKRRYIIFLSDGDPGIYGGDPASNPRYAMQDNFIAGTNTPATYTVFLTPDADPQPTAKLIEMTENIKANGYSETNPTSMIWAMSSDYDMLLNSILMSVVAQFIFSDDNKAGTKLKSKTDWDGTDEFGFSALPAGARGVNQDHTPNAFMLIGDAGYWWSAIEYSDIKAFNVALFSRCYSQNCGQTGEPLYFGWFGSDKKVLNLVRCLKN